MKTKDIDFRVKEGDLWFSLYELNPYFLQELERVVREEQAKNPNLLVFSETTFDGFHIRWKIEESNEDELNGTGSSEEGVSGTEMVDEGRKDE